MQLNLNIKENYSWLEAPWERFIKRLQAGQLPHAILLTGTSGTGRHLLAEQMVGLMLCEKTRSSISSDSTACGHCRSCRMLAVDGHPDYFVLRSDDDSSQIKVDQVRELLERLALSAGRSGYRVALIRHAEQLNVSAANALLKTLEEPGKKTLLLLVSSHPGQLPATIFSRCQQWRIPTPLLDTGVNYLLQHVSHESTVDEHQLALQLAGGGPLLAADYIEHEWVEEARRIANGLQGLREGNVSLNEIVEESKAIPAERCWRWLHFWLHRWQVEGQLPNSPAIVSLYQQALQSDRQSGSGLRYELQLHAWLLQWKKITES